MFKKARREEVREPEELTIYRKNKPVEAYEPKRTFKKNLTIFLGLLFVVIVVGTTLYEVKEAEAAEAVYKPGKEENTTVAVESSEEITQKSDSAAPQQEPETQSALWQGFHPRVLALEENIVKRINEIGAQDIIDPNVAAVMIQIESCGHKHATSESGAIGLGQVMPFHFDQKKLDEEPKDWPYRPYINLPKSFGILRDCLIVANGEYAKAFACYNAGLYSNLENPTSAEARRYVYWATGILSDIDAGLSESPVYQEWLDFGGASLCDKNYKAGLRVQLFGE